MEHRECPVKFQDLACAEFAASVSRSDLPTELFWMRDFAGVFCDLDAENETNPAKIIESAEIIP